MRVLTVGHGSLDQSSFTTLVAGVGIARIVDVRRFPGSRTFPHFRQEEMERWLPEVGIDYRWVEPLGGRRRPVTGSVNTALRHPQFRAYADHMASEEFGRGVDHLLELASQSSTAVLCSESVWWRCHRRLVADHLTLVSTVAVEHLFHDGRLQPHPAMVEAVLDQDHLIYPETGSCPSSTSE